MNKKMRELNDEIKAKISEAKILEKNKALKEADTLLDEIENLDNQLEEETKKFNLAKEQAKGHGEKMEKNEVMKEFAKMARRSFKALNETTGSDGGYAVPQDIDTTIQELRQNADALETYATVTKVNTLSGSRTYKKRSANAGFSKVVEGAKIGAGDQSEFELVEYKCNKYADILPVTNELLADTDANITGTVVNWLSDGGRVTRNKLILSAVDTSAPVAVTTFDDIKKIYNKNLKPCFRPYIKIYTNQDGLQFLDTLKDDNKNYILQPTVADPTKFTAGGFEVVVLDNDTFAPTTEGKAPFIIGDMSQVVVFDRNHTELKSSEDFYFDDDMTAWRAIERLDVKNIDAEALVYAEA